MTESDIIFLLLLIILSDSGRASDAHKLTGLLHGRVTLICYHETNLNVNVELIKYEGSNNRLLYTFNGSSNNYQSYCHNIKFDLQNKSFTLENLSVNDEGIYEIKIISTHGVVINKCNNTVSVLSPPVARRINVSSSNDTLTLRCEVSGEYVLLLWMRDGILLPDHQRYVLTDKNKTLKVSNLSSLDNSTYTCKVSNAAGSSVMHLNQTANNNTGNNAANSEDRNQTLYFAILASVIGLILFTIICIFGCCKINVGHKTERGQTPVDNVTMEEPVYNEPICVQDITTPIVKPLPYIYTDFIKPKTSHQNDQADDFGYSTIEEVQMNSQPQLVT